MTAVEPPAGAAAVGIRGGRRAPAKTEVHDWLPLSGASAEAVKLYGLLRMHVNRERGDDLVWTTTLTLAVLMGYSRGDKISKYINELVGLKAIDVHRGGLHNRNIYTVHQTPPPGYAGPTSLRAWYAMHRPLLEVKRQEEKRDRDARRAAAKAKNPQAAAETAGGDDPPVNPERGEQAGGAVNPGRGELVDPERGEPVHPARGREPSSGFEPPVIEPPPPPTPTPAPPAPSPAGAQEQEPPGGGELPTLTDDEQGLVDDVLAANLTGWDPVELVAVVTDERIRRRDPELVRRTFLTAAVEPRTYSPRRLLAGAYPGWRRTGLALARERGQLPNEPAADEPAGRRRRAVSLPWCKQPDCDPVTRQALNAAGLPYKSAEDPAGDFVLCPRCGPYASTRRPS